MLGVMVELAAIMATLILAGLSVFQILLILGAPLGRFAWGGAHTVLPRRLRIASALSIILYVGFALAILSNAGLILPGVVPTSLMWVLTGYFALGVVMNAISRSKPERAVMTPVALVLGLLFLNVTLA